MGFASNFPIARHAEQEAMSDAVSHFPDLTPGLRDRRSPLIVLLIASLGALLRVNPLTDRSFWFDEAFFWRLSQFPAREIVARVGQDSYPPLYPLALKAWGELFGWTPCAIRSLSVLCGLVSIAAGYLFSLEAFGPLADDPSPGRRRCATRIALVAAAMIAVNPFQARYAEEARVYAMGVMLALCSSWALLRAIRVKSFFAWAGYVAFTLAFLYTHYFALLSVFSQAAFIATLHLSRARWKASSPLTASAARSWLLATIVLAAGWLPWAPVFLGQHQRDLAAAARPVLTVESVLEAPFTMFWEPEDARPSTAAALCVFCASEAVLVALLIRRTFADLFLFTSVLGPCLLAILISLVDTSVFAVRYLAFAQVFWLIAIAAVAARLPIRWPSLTIGMLLVVETTGYAQFLYVSRPGARPGARAVARELDARRTPGEPVIVCSALYYYPLLYHLESRDHVYIYNEPERLNAHLSGRSIIRIEDLISMDEITRLTSARLWVVDMANGWGPFYVPIPDGWRELTTRQVSGTWLFEGDYVLTEYRNNHQPPITNH